MNLAGLRFDRTAAVIDGRIKIEDVNVINTPGGKAAIQGLLSGAFDAAEVPFARYVSWINHGAKLRAAPIFTDRLFQHEYIYTRADSGIESLADLRGRRVVCAPSYFATPSFWHRALLKDEAGIEYSIIAGSHSHHGAVLELSDEPHFDRMLKELAAHPELGCLGGHQWVGNPTILVQYWKSFEALERFGFILLILAMFTGVFRIIFSVVMPIATKILLIGARF